MLPQLTRLLAPVLEGDPTWVQDLGEVMDIMHHTRADSPNRGRLANMPYTTCSILLLPRQTTRSISASSTSMNWSPRSNSFAVLVSIQRSTSLLPLLDTLPARNLNRW